VELSTLTQVAMGFVERYLCGVKKLFLSITNETDNPIGAFFGLATLDGTEDFANQMMEKIEQLTQVEPGKCTYLYSPKAAQYTADGLRARWGRWLADTPEGRVICRHWKEWVAAQVKKYE
jgi:hypothetical protein